MTCYIFGAGEYGDFPCLPAYDDFIIAADGGYDALLARGLRPDLVVGDFDSCQKIPEHETLVRLKREKDDSDVAVAVRLGMERGYKRFVILGGTGGRFSHTMANIQLLMNLSQNGCCGILIGCNDFLVTITDGAIDFGPQCTGYISIFSLSDVSRGVTLSGLKYNIEKQDLKNNRALGLSNEFIGAPSAISADSGTLLIVTDLSNYPYAAL